MGRLSTHVRSRSRPREEREAFAVMPSKIAPQYGRDWRERTGGTVSEMGGEIVWWDRNINNHSAVLAYLHIHVISHSVLTGTAGRESKAARGSGGASRSCVGISRSLWLRKFAENQKSWPEGGCATHPTPAESEQRRPFSGGGVAHGPVVGDEGPGVAQTAGVAGAVETNVIVGRTLAGVDGPAVDGAVIFLALGQSWRAAAVVAGCAAVESCWLHADLGGREMRVGGQLVDTFHGCPSSLVPRSFDVAPRSFRAGEHCFASVMRGFHLTGAWSAALPAAYKPRPPRGRS